MRAWLLVGLLGACGQPDAPPPEVVALHGEVYGSTWSVRWVQPLRPVTAEVVQDAALRVFRDIDVAASTWRDDSDLSTARRGGVVPVSGDTHTMVALALEVAAATDGAFDPTVQPLVELWKVHGERRTTWPTDDEIAAAQALVGWDRVRQGWTDGRPWLDLGGTALDLSSLAPGHAADRVSDALAALGVPDHLVDVGGEVRVRGRGPSGGPWRMGIDRPTEGTRPGEDLLATVALTDRAIASSGNYRNAYDVPGGRIVHELDPRTGRPVVDGVAAVSVVAPTAAAADAWATALMVLGVDGLDRLAAWPDVDAVVVIASPDGPVLRSSPGMAAWGLQAL